MGIKGSWRRPRSTTRQEEELRDDLYRGRITERTFTVRFNKLRRKGLIKRDGVVVK